MYPDTPFRYGLVLMVLLVSGLSFLVVAATADEDGMTGGFMHMPTWLYNKRVAEGATDTFLMSDVIGGPLPTVTPDPTYANYIDEGNTALSGGAYREAIKAYESAIAIKPKSFDGWLGKAQALEGLKRYQSAIDAYDTALGYRSTSEGVWMAYGGKARCSLELNQFKEAIGLFEKAITSYENSGADDEEAYQALLDGLDEANSQYGTMEES